MKDKIVAVGATVFLAFAILSVSLLKCVTPNYAYSPVVLSAKSIDSKSLIVDYDLPYQGRVLPDSPFWYIKVLRDKVWYTLTFDPIKKARLNLLFADKRLASALELFRNNKPDLGVSTLSKSGKYMEKAEKLVGEDKDLLTNLALSSLKHRQIIENEILLLSPEDLKAEVVKIEDYSKLAYKNTKDKMLKIGLIPPENPFELQ